MPPQQTSSIHEHVRIKRQVSVAGVRGQRVLRAGGGRRPGRLIPPVNCVIGKGKTAEIRDPSRGWRRLALALAKITAAEERALRARLPHWTQSFWVYFYIHWDGIRPVQLEWTAKSMCRYLSEKLLKCPELLTGKPASPRYAENTFSCIFVTRKNSIAIVLNAAFPLHPNAKCKVRKPTRQRRRQAPARCFLTTMSSFQNPKGARAEARFKDFTGAANLLQETGLSNSQLWRDKPQR